MDYTGTGGVVMGGSATAEWFAYQLRETVYRLDKARQGTLEKITVKQRFYNDAFFAEGTRLTYPGVAKIQAYRDTFNTVYLQEELVRYDEAVSLAS